MGNDKSDFAKVIRAANRPLILAAKLRPVRMPVNKKAYKRKAKHPKGDQG